MPVAGIAGQAGAKYGLLLWNPQRSLDGSRPAWRQSCGQRGSAARLMCSSHHFLSCLSI